MNLNKIFRNKRIFKKIIFTSAIQLTIKSAVIAAVITAPLSWAAGRPCSIRPAFAAPKTAREQTWELTRSFGEAVRQQDFYGWLWLLIIFLALGILTALAVASYRREKERRGTGAVLISPGLDEEETRNAGDAPHQTGAPQKRAWVRLSVQREASFSRAGAAAPGSRAHVVNLSGGGMLLKAGERLSPGDELNVSFELEPNLQFDLPAQVVWAEEKSSAEGTFYLAGIKFTRIRHGTQDRIVRWILQEQRRAAGLPRAAGESTGGDGDGQDQTENDAPAQ